MRQSSPTASSRVVALKQLPTMLRLTQSSTTPRSAKSPRARRATPVVPSATAHYAPKVPKNPDETFLSEAEISQISFEYYIRSGIKTRDLATIRGVIDGLGVHCMLLDNQLSELIDEVCEPIRSTRFTLAQFLMLFHHIKNRHKKLSNMKHKDIAEAFVSVGGDDDLGGAVSASLLKRRIVDFGLQVNIDRLLEEVDEDHSGSVEYDEFTSLMLNLRDEGGMEDVVTDSATLFSMFGGDPDNAKSIVEVGRVVAGFDSYHLPPAEKRQIRETLAYLQENGPTQLNFTTFLDYFCDSESFRAPRKRVEVSAPQETVSASSQRLKRFSVSAFQYAAKNNAQCSQDPSLWLKARLAKVWSIHQMKSGRNAFPLSLVHLLNLDADLLASGAERFAGGHRLWGAVARAAILLKEHGYFVASELSKTESADKKSSKTKQVKSRTPRYIPPKPPAGYEQESKRRSRHPGRHTSRPLVETAPFTPQINNTDVEPRHLTFESSDDVVRSIFRANKRQQSSYYRQNVYCK